MLSWSRGSVEGEDTTNGATRASANEYPEYRQANWNYPIGYTNGDQRHKVRVFGTWQMPVPKVLGQFALGFMQRYDSGGPWDYNLGIDTRPYVTNPGYLVLPSSVTYYATGRGEFRFEGAWRSDLSLSWNHKVVGKSQLFLRAVVNNVFNLLSRDVRLDGRADPLGPVYRGLASGQGCDGADARAAGVADASDQVSSSGAKSLTSGTRSRGCRPKAASNPAAPFGSGSAGLRRPHDDTT